MAFRIYPLAATIAVVFSTGLCNNVSAQKKQSAPQVLNAAAVNDCKI